MYHLFRRKVLTQFECMKCRKKWLIGQLPKRTTHLYCPWCGKRQRIIKAK